MNAQHEKTDTAIDVASKLEGSLLHNAMATMLPRLLKPFNRDKRPLAIHGLIFDFTDDSKGDMATSLLPVYVASLEDIGLDIPQELIKLYGQIPPFNPHQYQNNARYQLRRAIVLELGELWIELLKERSEASGTIFAFFLKVTLGDGQNGHEAGFVVDAIREATSENKVTTTMLGASIVVVTGTRYEVEMGYAHQRLLALSRTLFQSCVRNMGLDQMKALAELPKSP